MSSLLLSHDLHLMMLEVAVENLFVPWSSEFDKVILKKTTVMFRMLDEDWTSLSPNRRDHRSYRGSSYENEKFYGGGSVVFCVPEGFLEQKANGVDVQLLVRKEVCKYFEMDSCQNVGFAAVPVDDLLNSIAKQIHERNELAKHLSDFYKRQIISRSVTGTYALLDENFQETVATISLYIRISYLGKCVITEITRECIPKSFCARGESDEEHPYHLQELTLEDLQNGRWKGRGASRVPRGRLICRCEDLVREEATDLVDGKVAAAKEAKDLAGERIDADTEADIDADTDLLMTSDDEAIDTEGLDLLTDVKGDTAAAEAQAKGRMIGKNGEAAFKKAAEPKRGTTTATIGIVEKAKRPLPPSPSLSCLQMDPLCCQSQPPQACFIPSYDVSPCYCHWMLHPLQFYHCVQ